MSGANPMFGPDHPLHGYNGKLWHDSLGETTFTTQQKIALHLARQVQTLSTQVASHQGFNSGLAFNIINLAVGAFSLSDNILPKYLGVMSRDNPQLVAARKVQLPDNDIFDPNTNDFLFGNLRDSALWMLDRSRANLVDAVQATFFFETYELSTLRAMRRGLNPSNYIDSRTLNAERLISDLGNNYWDAFPKFTNDSILMIQDFIRSIPAIGQSLIYVQTTGNDGLYLDSATFSEMTARQKIQLYIAYLEDKYPHYVLSNFYKLLKSVNFAFGVSEEMTNDVNRFCEQLPASQVPSYQDYMILDLAEQIGESASRMYQTVECLAENKPYNLFKFEHNEKRTK